MHMTLWTIYTAKQSRQNYKVIGDLGVPETLQLSGNWVWWPHVLLARFLNLHTIMANSRQAGISIQLALPNLITNELTCDRDQTHIGNSWLPRIYLLNSKQARTVSPGRLGSLMNQWNPNTATSHVCIPCNTSMPNQVFLASELDSFLKQCHRVNCDTLQLSDRMEIFRCDKQPWRNQPTLECITDTLPYGGY